MDFTYIDDLLQGIVLAIVHPNAHNQTFNLTYGSARSLNQMADILRQEIPGIEIKHNPRDALMPERGTLSIDKAKKLIGYQPAFPLERGFCQYINWYKDLAARAPQFFRPNSR